MILKPLDENAAVRKLLEVVPPVFRAEIIKTLLMIRLSSWLAGFDAANVADDATQNARELLGLDDEWETQPNPTALREMTDLDVGTPEKP